MLEMLGTELGIGNGFFPVASGVKGVWEAKLWFFVATALDLWQSPSLRLQVLSV
jgi:hypothetical protein